MSTQGKLFFPYMYISTHWATYVVCIQTPHVDTEWQHALMDNPDSFPLLSLSHTQNMHSCFHFALCSARLHYKLSLVLLPIKRPGNLGRWFSPSPFTSPISLSLSHSLSLLVSFTLSMLLTFFPLTPFYPFSHSPFPHHPSFVSQYSPRHKLSLSTWFSSFALSLSRSHSFSCTRCFFTLFNFKNLI